MCLGAPEAPSVADLAALPHVRTDRLAAAIGELRDGESSRASTSPRGAWRCASGSSSPAPKACAS